MGATGTDDEQGTVTGRSEVCSEVLQERKMWSAIIEKVMGTTGGQKWRDTEVRNVTVEPSGCGSEQRYDQCVDS